MDLAVDFRVVAVPQGVGDMANARQKLPETIQQNIIHRIQAIEKNTDAEIVCAVATESGRYDRAECVWGLIAGVLTLLLAEKIATLEDWDVPTGLPVVWQAFSIVVGFIAGSVIASFWHGLRRLLVSDGAMRHEVERSANYVFQQFGIGNTKHSGGILIYLSLFEKQIAIRGDNVIMDNFTSQDLEQIRDAVLAELVKGQVADGMMAGLDEAEKLVCKAIPCSGKGEDQLPNDLLIFHPRP